MARRLLPEKVVVGPYAFTVIEADEEWYKSHNLYGLMSPHNLAITVYKDNKASLILDTFLHEILHAVHWAYNIEETDNEERMVTTMSTGLTQVIITNPGVAATIISLSHRARKEAAL